MSTLSDILGSLQMWCGNPDTARLPLSTMLEVIYTTQAALNVELQSSDQSRLLEPHTFRPRSAEADIGIHDLTFVEAVQVRAAGDRFAQWADVAIVGFPDIENMRSGGRRAVAFYGSPASLAFSWNPTNEEVRVWHEPTHDAATSLDETLGLPQAFVSLLKLRAAAMCREMIGLPLAPVLNSEIMRWEREWKRWRESNSQKGVTRKIGFHTRRRWMHN